VDNISIRTGVVADGQRLLLSQFRNGSNVEDLLGALLAEAQLFEDACIPLIESFWLANATGWVLDQYGKLVGYERPSYGPAYDDDDAFRILIYGQIGANVSYGTLPDLYQILGALQLGSAYIADVYPAAIVVNYEQTQLSAEYDFVRDVLERATHPIEIDITETTASAFGLLGDDTALGLSVGEIGRSL